MGTSFNFDKDLQQGNKIPDLSERLLFFKKRLKEYKQSLVGNLNIGFYYTYESYIAEINFIEEQIKHKPQSQQEPAKLGRETDTFRANEIIKRYWFY